MTMFNIRRHLMRKLDKGQTEPARTQRQRAVFATDQPRLSTRLSREVKLLRKAAGGRSKVLVGPKTVDGKQYTAVLVTNVRISTDKFRVTTTDMLFLLPPDYPRLPPIGCYLNYKWKTADHHFTLQSHFGAPLLVGRGWYWYCVGLGGGFDTSSWVHRWRPATNPDKGHNLSTLFVAARHAINLGD